MEKCKFVAAYSYPPMTPQFCVAHKTEGMVRYVPPPPKGKGRAATAAKMQSASTQIAAIFENQKSSSSNPVANEVFEEILSYDLESSGPSGSETETEEEDDVQCESSDEDIVETVGVDTNLAEESHEYEGLEIQYPKKNMEKSEKKNKTSKFR